PEGLPLVPGLIELITKESSAPGQRHAALSGHIGEIAIRTWRGNPKDPSTTSGVDWILGERWVPYQKATFVTPAFPGFVSGDSSSLALSARNAPGAGVRSCRASRRGGG